jgi:hypothetical protein
MRKVRKWVLFKKKKNSIPHAPTRKRFPQRYPWRRRYCAAKAISNGQTSLNSASNSAGEKKRNSRQVPVDCRDVRSQRELGHVLISDLIQQTQNAFGGPHVHRGQALLENLQTVRLDVVSGDTSVASCEKKHRFREHIGVAQGTHTKKRKV